MLMTGPEAMITGRKNTARAARGRGNDDSAVGILLAHRKGVRANYPVFSRLRTLVNVPLIVKLLRLSFHLKSAGESADMGKSLSYRIAHNVPDREQKGLEISVLVGENVVGKTNILRLAKLGDLAKTTLGVYLVVWNSVAVLVDNHIADYPYLTAADRQNAHLRDRLSATKSHKIHLIWMLKWERIVGIKGYFDVKWGKGVGYRSVGAVSASRLCKRAVKSDLDTLKRRIPLQELLCGKSRAHRVRA